jgi:hypothetical protein
MHPQKTKVILIQKRTVSALSWFLFDLLRFLQGVWHPATLTVKHPPQRHV